MSFVEHTCEADQLGGLVFPQEPNYAMDSPSSFFCFHSANLPRCGQPAYLQLAVPHLDGSPRLFWLCFEHYEKWTKP